MNSVKRTLAVVTVLLALSSSLCACGNKKDNTDNNSASTVESTAEMTETATETTTTAISPEDVNATPMEDFTYAVMTRNNYEKYGEDAIGKIIILGYKGDATSIKIPRTCDGVEIIAIGENAFENSNITEVELPSSIRIIEDYAFSKCTNLTKINEVPNIESLGRCVFDETQWLKNKQAGLDSTDSEKTETSTTTETTSDTATKATAESTQDKAEQTQPKAESTLPQGVVAYSGWIIDGSTCSGDIVISGTDIKAIAKDAFRINSSIKSVDITNTGIEVIDDYAFSESSLAIIKLPNSMKRFGEAVFSKCLSLESIDLTNTVVSELSENLFSDSSIKSVSFPKIKDTNAETADTASTADTAVVANDTNSETATKAQATTTHTSTEEVKSEKAAESSDTEQADENKGTDENEGTDEFDGLKVIGYGAFNNCKNLGSLDLGTKLITISDYAFAGTALNKVQLPDSLESIGARAFSNCANLESITFGKSIKSIGDEAFVKCEKLLKITVPKNVQSVGNKSFGYTYKDNEKDLKKIDNIQIDCLKGSAIEKYCMDSDIKYNIIASAQN